MRSKQTMFFTVLSDIELILKEIEMTLDLKYYKTGLFEDKNTPSFQSIFDTSNLATTQLGDWNRVDTYLVIKADHTINIRSVLQRKGGVKFAIDQKENPKSIELKLGGLYTEKKNVIIAGRVSTISEDIDSMELYKLISTKIKKRFKKIDGFYVGHITEEKLRNGWRLVTNLGLSSEFDLTLNE